MNNIVIRKTTDPRNYARWPTDSATHWTITPITLPINHPSTMNVSLKASQKGQKKFQVQKNTNIFDSIDPKLTDASSITFKLACNTNCINADITMRLLHKIVKAPVSATWNSRIVILPKIIFTCRLYLTLHRPLPSLYLETQMINNIKTFSKLAQWGHDDIPRTNLHYVAKQRRTIFTTA